MHVRRLDLLAFRNYATLEYSPGPGVNVLIGENAQGKSNLLESLYALATTKSLRTNRDSEMVRFDSDMARAAALVHRELQGDLLLEIVLAGPASVGIERKAMRINRIRQPRIADGIGQLNVVLFSSLDLDIVRGEPEERRRFLNYEIAQVSPRYVMAFATYRRALEQRNRLLKEMRMTNGGGISGGIADTLDTWSAQIVEHGARLIERRRAYVTQLGLYAAEIQQTLSGGRESLRIEYVPSFPLDDAITVDEIASKFVDALRVCRRDEMARGVTLVGPQRDDLVFRIVTAGDVASDARTYGSQGQQRTVALALRLAERQLMEEMVGEPPVVLLDDVLSDLDDRRRDQIFQMALRGGQTFLTTTELSALPEALREQGNTWSVVDGQIRPVAKA